MGFFSGFNKGYQQFSNEFDKESEKLGGCLGEATPWLLIIGIVLVGIVALFGGTVGLFVVIVFIAILVSKAKG